MKFKKNIILMYAITFLQGMVFYSAVATLYRQAVGVSVFQITLIESISLALSLALELPCGIIAEKIGYRRMMILCNVLYFVSKVIFWQADGFGMFLIERILLGFIFAGLSGVDTSILYLSCEEDYVQRAFGFFDGLGTAGMLLAAGTYTVLLHGQYRMAALFTVISYGLAMVLTFFLQEVKPAEQEETPPVHEFFVILKDTLHRKDLLLFLLAAALFSECHQTITVFLNQLQYTRAGMSDQMIGLAYIVMTVAGLISVRSEHVTRLYGQKKTGALLIGTGAICCITLACTSNPWLSVGAILLLQIAASLAAPLFSLMSNQQITHPNRATALSIYSILMDGVAIATNLVYGQASDVSLSLALGLGAVFCLISLLCFLHSIK